MNRQWKVMELKPVSQYGDILGALKELQEVGCELLVEGNHDAAAVAVMCCQQLVREAVRLTGDHNRERNLVALEALRVKVQALDSLMMEGRQLPKLDVVPFVPLAEKQLPNNNGNPAPVLARQFRSEDLLGLGWELPADTGETVWLVGKPGGTLDDWACYIGFRGMGAADVMLYGVKCRQPGLAGDRFPELRDLRYRA